MTVPTLQFDSTDLGATEAFLSRAYTKMRIGGRAESTRARVSRAAAGSVSADDLAIDYDMSRNAEAPLGKLCLCILHEGRIIRRYFPDGGLGHFGPGDVFLYAPSDRPYAGFIQRARYTVTMFDPELFGQVADGASGRRPDPIRLTADRPVSAAAEREFRSVVRHLRDHVLADPFTSEQPLIVATASQLLGATVLAAFPNNRLADPTAADHRDGHTATLRRAMAYIDRHADQPISLPDIAAAAGVTGRALQVAFRLHRDTTPMGYLRQVRRDGAQHDLQAADPTSGVTVAGAAARWGFGPAARFTTFYEQQYGELPSQTLRT